MTDIPKFSITPSPPLPPKNNEINKLLLIPFNCFKGTFTVPVGQLATPRKKKLLIRNIDGKAVDALKEKIIQHPNGFYSRIPVIAPELRSKEDFKEEDLPLLRLETLGNNHLRRASQELVLDKRYADCSFIANREVTIYAGLTDDEAVSLAVQHQLDQNRTHSLSFMDKVKLCRKHFSGFKGISETEIGIEDTVVPNEFKASMCDLLEEQYSRDNPKVFINEVRHIFLPRLKDIISSTADIHFV